MLTRTGGGRVLLALLALCGGSAEAHELEIDQLRIWVDPRGDLHAQLLLDPELTRPVESAISDDEARNRVRTFALSNLRLETDGAPCALTATTRELYVLGGAAPADVIKLQCTPQGPVRSLNLKLGSSLPRLAVEAVGFATGGVTDPLTKVQLVSGGSSLTFERHAAVQAADSQATASAQTTAAPIRGWFSNFIQFVPIGVEHIVPGGLDHVLFVVGLSLRRAKFRSLMWQLAAFTVAHTLTLALATLGWVQAPAAVVEPLIAASIVAVALANLRASDSEQLQPRVGLCFGFGLIHGLGFAGALGQLGLQRQGLISALLGFNLGVELGQVLVAVSTLLLLSLARSFNKVSAVERWASVAIAFVGVYLLVDRV